MKECRKVFFSIFRKLHQFYFDQGNNKKNWMVPEMKVRKIKINGRFVKAGIIYDYYMLGAFLMGSGGNCQNNNNKKEEEHNPDTLKHLLYAWGCSKGLLWNFCQDSMLQ